MLAFALTIFTGAFLLFLVQPLIGKFILPWFGGTLAVWTTCMLFFQVLLLVGYSYAHLLSRWLRPRGQAATHLVLLLLSLALLPIIPADSWKPLPGDEPTTRILLLLGATIGLPYFILSTTGPLMQSWFAQLHVGKSPYRLFALSNLGSMLGLLAYPLLLEPTLPRRLQALSWGWGLAAYVAFASWCAWLLWRRGAETPEPECAAASGGGGAAEAEAETPTLREKSLWLALPACASALLLGTTNKLCQDVAVVPFLWVLPLSLYLLSFILCFADNARMRYRRWLYVPAMLGCFVWLLGVLHDIEEVRLAWQIAAFCTTLFVTCMVCHGELYALRPHPRRLTAYYLVISFGGALGGFLVAVAAPHVFRTYAELAWSIGACSVLAWLVCLPKGRAASAHPWPFRVWLAGSLVPVAVCVAFFLQIQGEENRDNLIEATRNFYGVLSVIENGKENPASTYRVLRHGQITHGIQLTHPMQRRRLTTYFGESSGLALAIKNFPRAGRRIGVVGLGAGTTAAYGRSGDTIRFYEINPEVKRIAMSYFTFVNDAINLGAKVDIILGDARLSMEAEEPQRFDVLALDAFSGDAIPVHLLTREAFALYGRHLAADGVLVVHISNHYLDLEPVLKGLAQEFGYQRLSISDDPSAKLWWVYGSTWVLLSKNKELMERVTEIANETKQVTEDEPRESVPLWTDDYTSLLPIITL